MHSIQLEFTELLRALRQQQSIRTIGKAGGSAIPDDGFSDIDLFLFCAKIPVRTEREELLRPLAGKIAVSCYGETEHPHWGLVDSVLIGKQEIYLMYFTQDAFQVSVASILRGERTEREENYFYPTGRLASIQGMHAFHDPDGFLTRLKSECSAFPDALQEAILCRCLPKIDDAEDFRRAIRRKDVLFYHATLDLALDRFLQALFAFNRVFFPSRKRSFDFIRRFAAKPRDCAARLERILSLGADGDTLDASYRLWHELCMELLNIIE